MSFFKKYKEEIIFGYVTLISMLLLIVFIYAVVVSAIATDLADLIQTGGC